MCQGSLENPVNNAISWTMAAHLMRTLISPSRVRPYTHSINGVNYMSLPTGSVLHALSLWVHYLASGGTAILGIATVQCAKNAVDWALVYCVANVLSVPFLSVYVMSSWVIQLPRVQRLIFSKYAHRYRLHIWVISVYMYAYMEFCPPWNEVFLE